MSPLQKVENRVEIQRISEYPSLLVIQYNLWNTQERFNRHWIMYDNIVNKSKSDAIHNY